jgi:stage II sporulation protein M
MSYKLWVFIAIFLFVAGLVIGLVMPPNISGLLSGDVTAFEEFSGTISSLPTPEVFILIFVRNVFVVAISIVLSPVFCLVPLMALVFNGWIIGLISIPVVQQKSIGFLLAGILPHGIFELPAFIIGEAIALSFGAAAMLSVFKEDKKGLLLANLRQNAKYLVAAVILFFVAALFEAYLTPLFLT